MFVRNGEKLGSILVDVEPGDAEETETTEEESAEKEPAEEVKPKKATAKKPESTDNLFFAGGEGSS